MAITKSRPAKGESLLAWLIVGVLGLAALWTVVQSFSPNPAVTLAGLTAVRRTKALVKDDLPVWLPVSQVVPGRVERFDSSNLHLKINGKAELYLASGFRQLLTRRFSLQGRTADWFEVFRYEMTSLDSAFAVYSQQRRPRAGYLTLTPYANWTRNGLFLVHGPFYVEVIASRPDPTLKRVILAWAGRFVAGTAVRHKVVTAQALFPPENLDRRSFLYYVKSAFGFRRLDRVFAARYGSGPKALTAFISRRTSAAQATSLAGNIVQTLIQSGGKDRPVPPALPGSRAVAIAGVYEVVFSHGPFLAGVHQAPDLASALSLARRLQQHLQQAKP